MSTPICYLTRIEQFSAAHRLHSTHLSDNENAKLFGLCNNPNGHGHNYKLEVTLRGTINPQTGMLINITDLKSCINEHVLKYVDHKNLDLDCPYFKNNNLVSTTENLVVFIWKQLVSNLPKGALLHELKLWETDKNIIIYRGETK